MINLRAYIFGTLCLLFIGLQSTLGEWTNYHPTPINSGRVNIKIHLKREDDPGQAKFEIRDYVYLKNRNSCLYTSDTSSQVNSKVIGKKILDLTFQNLYVPKYVAIEYNVQHTRWLGNFIVEDGDSIEVSMTPNGPIFKGRNAHKYQCQAETYKIINQLPNDQGLSASQFIGLLNSAGRSCFDILESFRKYLPDLTYYTLKTDIIANLEYRRNFYTLYIAGQQKANINKLPNDVWNDKIRKELMSVKALDSSTTWCEFNLEQYIYDSCGIKENRVNVLKAYNYFIKNFEGLGREWLISKLLTKYRFDIEDNDKFQFCVSDALSSGYILTNSTKENIRSLSKIFSLGAPVYNFTLSDMDGKVIRLSDFRGKLVLLDFYCYHCGACKSNHPIIDSIKKVFKGKNFQIISIYSPSPNYGRKTWVSFVQDEVYSSRDDINLIDDDLLGGKGNVISNLQINGFPTFIVVDKNGNRLSNPDMPLVDQGKSLCKIVQDNL